MDPDTYYREAWHVLLEEPRVRSLALVAGSVPAHLVGGSLRDAALRLPVRDLDFVVDRDGEGISERFATAQASRPIRLGGDRFAAFRVPTGATYVDIWDLRGGELEADLLRRDLTINAIALSLDGGLVTDPSRGCLDLKRGLLRRTRPCVFHEDAVRVLRLARFVRELSGFSIDAATREEARDAASSLGTAPPERLRAELDLLLAARQAPRVMELLALLGIDAALGLPESTGTPLRARAKKLADCCERFACPSEEGADRALLWAFFAAQEKADPRPAEDRLRAWLRSGLLSRATFSAARLVLLPRWSPPADSASLRSWLHFAGESWREAVALRVATPPEGTSASTWEDVGRELLAIENSDRTAIISPPRLVTGLEVREILGYPPGPQIGEILSRLRRLQVAGTLKTREEALAHLRELAADR